MEYTIDKIEKVKSAKGTEYHRADLSQGTKLWVGVAIFGGFKDEELVAGGKVTGDMIEKEYRGKPSYTLNAPDKPKTAPGGGFKQKMIEETMEKKERSISRFQDSKEHSIKVASTFSAAWNAAIAELEAMREMGADLLPLSELFEKWREYFWFEFDVDEHKYPPFK